MIDFSFKMQEPRLLVERIVEVLREAITPGRLKPGEKLKEVEISNSLEASRSPVRDFDTVFCIRKESTYYVWEEAKPL